MVRLGRKSSLLFLVKFSPLNLVALYVFYGYQLVCIHEGHTIINKWLNGKVKRIETAVLWLSLPLEVQ